MVSANSTPSSAPPMPSISTLTPSRRRMSSRRSTVIAYTSSSPSASTMPLSGSGSITSSPSSTSTASCSTASGGPSIVSSAGDPIATVARPIPPIEISSTSLKGIGSPGLGGPVEPATGDRRRRRRERRPEDHQRTNRDGCCPHRASFQRRQRTAAPNGPRTDREPERRRSGPAAADIRRPAGALHTHPTRRCCPPPRNRPGRTLA